MTRFMFSLAAAAFGLALSASLAQASHGCCEKKDCCEPVCERICKPVADKKKVSKVSYDCKCEDFCLPKCGKITLSCRCKRNCGDCCANDCAPACPPAREQCQQCEKPRVRKVLIKKIKTVEEDTYKCVPELVARPVCPAACPPGCPMLPAAEPIAAPR